MSQGAEQTNYAVKTYRYLRIAIVGMVATVLIGILIDRLDTGVLLGSISAYYYTVAGPLFVGALIMIGVSLIVIRGETATEDVVLNLAGMLAPVVALVPTDPPGASFGYPQDRLLVRLEVEQGTNPPLLELPVLSELVATTVRAAVIGGAIAFALAYLLAALIRNHRLFPAELQQRWAAPHRWSTSTWGWIGAAALAVALVAIYRNSGSEATHITAAIGLFVGLWAAATVNGVREARDGGGRRTVTAARLTALGGSAAVAAAALVIVVNVRLVAGETERLLLLAGVAVALIAVLVLWPAARAGMVEYLRVLRSGPSFPAAYLLTAVVMLTAAVVFTQWPGDWPHRVFVLELWELLPFGAYWVIQTIDNWSTGVRSAPPYETAA
ncbi:MAG: hypothetical protein AAGD35_23160 [Actinomycetota bacterium]